MKTQQHENTVQFTEVTLGNAFFGNASVFEGINMDPIH